MEAVTRQILWNVPMTWVTALYLFSFGAGLWILLWFYRRSQLWRQGYRTMRSTLPLGIARLGGYLLSHRTIRRDAYAGIMHRLIFWGFLTELMATTLVAIQHHFHVTFLTGATYLIFSFVADLGGVALIMGLVLALFRRYTQGERGRLLNLRSTFFLIWLLLFVTFSGFLVEAGRIAFASQSFERWSFVGYGLSKIWILFGLTGKDATASHSFFWMVHAGLAVLFFFTIPLTLMRHVFLGAYNVMQEATLPGRVKTVNPALQLAGTNLSSFGQLDLLQADACLTCGRCAEVCPAEAAGKPLSPRQVVLGIRATLDEPISIFDQVKDEALWSCTTCHACDVACPIHIPIVDKIVAIRRGRIIDGRSLPATATQAMEAVTHRYNPFGSPNSQRMEWATGLSVPVAKPEESIELLYWVGCAGAFDPAAKEVTRAVVRILNALKVNYRVLGIAERCTGDPARRMGEEGLWRELAEHNRRLLASHSVKTILTHCPHCFHAFKNEYSELGPIPQVLHHSQWLRDRIRDGQIKLKRAEGNQIVFHDPCYLARANGEIEAPRTILDGIAHDRQPLELSAHGRNTLCCGGGGGQMWLDVRGTTRVETLRAKQVEDSRAGTVATGCPFCRVMLEAGRTSLPQGQGNWRVKDLAELVVEGFA